MPEQGGSSAQPSPIPTTARPIQSVPRLKSSPRRALLRNQRGFGLPVLPWHPQGHRHLSPAQAVAGGCGCAQAMGFSPYRDQTPPQPHQRWGQEGHGSPPHHRGDPSGKRHSPALGIWCWARVGWGRGHPAAAVTRTRQGATGSSGPVLRLPNEWAHNPCAVRGALRAPDSRQVH